MDSKSKDERTLSLRNIVTVDSEEISQNSLTRAWQDQPDDAAAASRPRNLNEPNIRHGSVHHDILPKKNKTVRAKQGSASKNLKYINNPDVPAVYGILLRTLTSTERVLKLWILINELP